MELDLEGDAECAKWLEELYIDVGDSASGCLLFPASGSDLPERVQLSLETVPGERRRDLEPLTEDCRPRVGVVSP